jgi:hypothetical protein
MLRRPTLELWPRVLAEEVATAVTAAVRWTQAKAGTARVGLWPTAPRQVERYFAEMLSAHTQSVTRRNVPTT